MTDHFNNKAHNILRNTKILAEIGIIFEFINLLLLIIYGNRNEYGMEHMPIYSRLSVIFSVFIGGGLFINSCKRLSRKIPGITSYNIFELKYAITIVCPYLKWSAITMLLMSIDDTTINRERIFIFIACLFSIGVLFSLLCKFFLKKELLKQNTNQNI